MTTCVCATHGHCFDGLASAALFGDLFATIKPAASITYVSCGYAANQPAPTLDGDDNVILDFRYQADPRLTFFFDHHATAFRDPREQDDFNSRSHIAPERFIWDPTAKSCAGLLARVAKASYEADLRVHQDLIAWAEKVDSAQFKTVEEATNRQDPVMQLVSVVERFGDQAFLNRAIPILRLEGLSALAEARFVKEHYRSVAPKFGAYEKRLEARGAQRGRVAFIDLTESPVTVVAKFSQYKSFPTAVYSVLVATMHGGTKISVGFNPWSGQELDLDLGQLCARHGGGGHKVVGAISFPPNQTARALELAGEIAKALQMPEQH